MKKKLIVLLLAAVLSVSVCVTGCGMVSGGSSVEDSDDEDDDDDREEDGDRDDKDDKDDKEDDDDKQPALPVFVDVIPDDELLSQIKVFVKNKSVWSVEEYPDSAVSEAGYFIADLDHNGRCELITAVLHDYGDTTSMRIFEIDEKGSFFKEADLKLTGIDLAKVQCPDIISYDFAETYFDDTTGLTHYLMMDSYDNGNGEYGTGMCDLCYHDGSAELYYYGGLKISETPDPATGRADFDCVYYAEGKEVSGDAFDNFYSSYPGRFKKDDGNMFGVYRRSNGAGCGVLGMDDEFLKDMLTDSYKVFIGEYDHDIFVDDYNRTDNVYVGPDFGSFGEKCVGTWNLTASELEGDRTYYDETSERQCVLVIDDDRTVHMTQYTDGAVSLQFDAELEINTEGQLFFTYDDKEVLPEGFGYETYTVTKLMDEDTLLEIELDFYDVSGDWMGYTVLFFQSADKTMAW